MTPPKVMVAGRWDESDQAVLEAACNLGTWLAGHGFWLLTGGGGGVARASAYGAYPQEEWLSNSIQVVGPQRRLTTATL